MVTDPVRAEEKTVDRGQQYIVAGQQGAAEPGETTLFQAIKEGRLIPAPPPESQCEEKGRGGGVHVQETLKPIHLQVDSRQGKRAWGGGGGGQKKTKTWLWGGVTKK